MIFQLGIMSLGHLFVDLMINVLPAALPLLMAKLDLTLALGGTVVALAKLTSGLFQPMVGHLMDRQGRPWLLPPSLIWTGVLIGAAGLVESYWALLLVAALGGLGSAVYHPLGMVMVRNTIPDRAGTVMSVWSVGGTLGMALAPLATLAVIAVAGVDGLWLFGIPAVALAAGCIMLGVHRLPVRLPGQARGSSDRQEDFLAAGTVSQGGDQRSLTLLSAALFLRSVLQMSLSTFLPAFYTLQGFSPEQGALMLAFYLTCGSLGSVLGGLLSDRWGRKTVTLVSQVLGPLFVFGFLVTGGWLSVACLGLGAANIFATFSVGVVYGQELMPVRPAAASGYIAGLAWGLAAIVLGPVGAIGDRWGLAVALAAVAIVCLSAAILIMRLPETLAAARRSYALQSDH